MTPPSAAAPNREFNVKEEVPKIKDEIENCHKNEADMETESLNIQLSSSGAEPAAENYDGAFIMWVFIQAQSTLIHSTHSTLPPPLLSPPTPVVGSSHSRVSDRMEWHCFCIALF